MHDPVQETQTLLARIGPMPAERRARVRYRCLRECLTRAFISNSYRSLPARLIDLSTDGLALILGEPLPVGTRVTVEPEEFAEPLELLVDVINVTAQDDGSWRHGCHLVWRISEEEMWLLLKSSSA